MSANRSLAGRAGTAPRACRARRHAAACSRISLSRAALIVCMVTGYMASSSGYWAVMALWAGRLSGRSPQRRTGIGQMDTCAGQICRHISAFGPEAAERGADLVWDAAGAAG
jgi:hypothetical protein